jgi:hypothetical protein
MRVAASIAAWLTPPAVRDGILDAMDEGAARAWMAQWRGAEQALAAQRKRELRALSPRDALAASDALLSIAVSIALPPSRLRSSGLVAQQALFHRRRPA